MGDKLRRRHILITAVGLAFWVALLIRDATWLAAAATAATAIVLAMAILRPLFVGGRGDA